MEFQKRRIIDIVTDIGHNKLYLPALQRKFVWGKPQIQMLFDSIMKDYPIGTFLFWKLSGAKASNYVFYKFLKEYDERDPFNKRFEGHFNENAEVIGVLDGQQRLSSLYVGLQGSHTERTKYKKKKNAEAYEKKYLYLNLLNLPYKIVPLPDSDDDMPVPIEDMNFEFQFWTEYQAENNTVRRVETISEDGEKSVKEVPLYWFKVGKVITWSKVPEFDEIVNKFIKSSRDERQKELLSTQKRLIKYGLSVLHKRITDEPLINFYEVNKEDLDDILEIFKRVNSGGTILNKTDLLFSTIVATWNDGREKIEELLKAINQKGDKFSFDNDYLMRCCLVLTDGPVLFKVHSFKSSNVQKIKDEWIEIDYAIRKTVDLLVEFGFNGQYLTSQNATLVIAYHIFKGGLLDENSKKEIHKYLIHALLNGIYGSAQDQVISNLRNALRVELSTESRASAYTLKSNSFTFSNLLSANLPGRKSLYINDEEIDRFLSYKKGPGSFFVLSLLYPHLRYNEVQFHQDHIHPSAKFSDQIFDEIGIPVDQRNEWMERRDLVPNLQLLEGRENETKQAAYFKDWLATKDEEKQRHLRVTNYIPNTSSLEFEDFILFFEERKKLLRLEIKKVLAISEQPLTSQLIDEPDEFEDSIEFSMEP